MPERFVRLVELFFTAYAVPALMVPFVWMARRLLKAVRPAAALEAANRLGRPLVVYAIVSAVWIGAWLALFLGLPIEKGGKIVGALCWITYGLLNAVLATLLVRFTGEYGALPEGPAKDRLFLRFLSAVAVQPLATAGAFAVLYRITGVLYHLKVPALAAVQEGI